MNSPIEKFSPERAARGSPRSQDVLRLAGKQYGLVTRAQLRELGMTNRKVDIRIRNRRLLPVGKRTGVYAVGRPIESRRAKCMAATLAAGGKAMVAGRAAADLWGFRDHQGSIEVVRPESRKPREFWLDGEGVVGRQRVVVRRSRHLPVPDRTRVHGIPVMNVARLFVGLAANLSDKALSDSFKQADMMGKLNEKELFRCAGLGRGWKGIRRFRALVERRHPQMKDADTHIEGLMLEIDRDFVQGNPVVHRRMAKYYPDFYYEDCGLLVETDGAEFHSGRLAFLEDSWRQNDLREHARQVIRFSTEEIESDPERVGRNIRRERKRCFQLKHLEELEAARAAPEQISA